MTGDFDFNGTCGTDDVRAGEHVDLQVVADGLDRPSGAAERHRDQLHSFCDAVKNNGMDPR